MTCARPCSAPWPRPRRTESCTARSPAASRQAKDAAARLFGERTRNGLYRLSYNAQSLVAFAALMVYLLRLPDRVLYRLTGRAAVAARLGQGAALVYGAAAAWQVGLLGLTGFGSAAGWVRWAFSRARGGDAPPVLPEPEAQGPGPDEGGRLRTGGPFRWSRHPLNLVPLLVICLTPTMTLKRATFAAVSAAYLVLGSRHEELRLRRAYGDAYERYRRSGVPFYLPGVASAASLAAPMLRRNRHLSPAGACMKGQIFVDALRALEERDDVTPLVRLHGAAAAIWSPRVGDEQLPNGPDGAERFWREYRGALRTVRSEFLSVTDGDGRSVLEWESSGEMRDGSPFTYRGVSIVEWDGDRIRRFATYFDPSALPAVPQRADGAAHERQAQEEQRGQVEQQAQHERHTQDEQQVQAAPGALGASHSSPRRVA